MMYFPSAYRPVEREAFKREGLVELSYKTSQGDQLAFYKPPEGAAKRIWIVFSGNGARSTDYRDIANHPHHGYLFIDYPGYGANAGKPSPKRIDASVDAAIVALAAHLKLEEAQVKSQLAAFGHSLGCAVALRAAERHEIKRIVLVSPFTTMKEMAGIAVGRLLSNVVTHRYDNVKAMAALATHDPKPQVVIFHGTKDDIVPARMGKALADAHPEFAQWRPIEGADHNGIVGDHLPTITAAMRAD